MPAAAVDTNVFLRVFIQDDSVQHRVAVDLVRSCGRVFIGTVVLVESVWALRKLYGFRRDRLVQFLTMVLETDAFVLEDREVAEAALGSYAAGHGDFADHVILAAARRQGVDRVYTFDLDFSRAAGVERLQARHSG